MRKNDLFIVIILIFLLSSCSVFKKEDPYVILDKDYKRRELRVDVQKKIIDFCINRNYEKIYPTIKNLMETEEIGFLKDILVEDDITRPALQIIKSIILFGDEDTFNSFYNKILITSHLREYESKIADTINSILSSGEPWEKLNSVYNCYINTCSSLNKCEDYLNICLENTHYITSQDLKKKYMKLLCVKY